MNISILLTIKRPVIQTYFVSSSKIHETFEVQQHRHTHPHTPVNISQTVINYIHGNISGSLTNTDERKIDQCISINHTTYNTVYFYIKNFNALIFHKVCILFRRKLLIF